MIESLLTEEHRMKSLKFKKMDAFTGDNSSGNPAGYIYMQPDELLNEAEMQTIAAELKGFVNEVGFVQQANGQYQLQYYSSECEVAFCGHATIAIMYDLLKNNRTAKEVLIRVKAGELPVFNEIEALDAVFISAPQPQFLPCPLTAGPTSTALGLAPDEINPALPLRLIDGGLRTLLVPLKTRSTCLNLYPAQETLRQFCLAHDLDIIHVFVKETSLPSALYRTRVFAPRFGYLEDPATGSGNAAFGYYLIDEGLWPGDFTLEQGPSKDHPNLVRLKRYEKEGRVSILFGGGATTRIEGLYYLHSIHS
jgi:PhzF family phenazine biosynthesis protein